MKLPHFFIANSPLPNIFGRLAGRPRFYAWTLFFWTFVDDDKITPKQVLHEYRHVQQFVIIWLVALLGWVLYLLDGGHWLWILATPLAFPWVYLLAGVGATLFGKSFYRQNWFEVDARIYAGEPV